MKMNCPLCFFVGILCLIHTIIQAQPGNDLALKSEEADFGIFRIIAYNNVSYRYHMGIKDTVKVGNGLYMALMHRSGATIEIDGGGVFAVKQLEKQLMKYRLANPQSPVNLKIKKSASISCKNRIQPIIFNRLALSKYKIHLPQTLMILRPKLSFTWDKMAGEANYQVKVGDSRGETMMLQTTQRTTITLDMSKEMDNHSDAVFFIQVGRPNQMDEMQPVVIQLVGQSIWNIYQKFQHQNKKNKRAQAMLLEAFFWQNRGFYLKANRVYQRLLKEYPDHPVFPTVYKYFRVVNHLERLKKN